MAISRPLVLAVLGAALLAATLLSVQNARNIASSEGVPAAQPGQAEEPPAAKAESAKSPVDTLESALSGKPPSAAFELRFELNGGGDSARVGLSGAFERGAAKDVPAVRLDAKVNASGQRFEGGFITVEETAWFTQGDKAYQLPPEAWDPVAQSVANDTGAQQGQAPPFELHPETWVRDAKIAGEEQLDGIETTHVAASIDVEAVARDITQAAQGNVGQLPSPKRLAGLVERADLDAWVGSDQILRRLRVRVAFDSGGQAASRVNFALDLSGVNKAQNIEAPANVRAGLPAGDFGRFVESFTAGLSGVTGGEPLSLAALSTANPKKAARAVRAGKKVVIFFRNPTGLDDRAVGRSVRALERRSSAVVLTDHVDAVERYGKLVEDLGVSQTPSLVLIDSAGDARLIEGFIDSSSLTQAVSDAR
jgi:hypothetical protein